MAVSLDIVPIKEDGPLCGICGRCFAKYTCPKCHLKYCTVNCYKEQKHANCSEQFYKDSFMGALKHQDTISSSEKKKMIEMLQRVDEDGSLKNGEEKVIESEEEELQERLSGIDIDSDPDQVWQRLTRNERNLFNRMMQNGELVDLIEETIPWWKKLRKVQFLDSQDDHTPLPPLPCNVQPLDTFIKSSVISPCICYNVINILYSYVYTVKMFNCDHTNVALSAIEIMLRISSVLSDDLSFTTIQDAISHVIASIRTQPDLSSPHQYCLSLIDELLLLMEPRGVVGGRVLGVHALADIIRLVCTAKKQLKMHKQVSSSIVTKQKLFLTNKKLLFLLSWCIDRGREELSHLVEGVRNIKEMLLNDDTDKD